MIRITSPDHIRTSGDFKLDGLLIKRHDFEKQPSELGKESLTIEAVPFKRMDDGEVLASKDRVHKIVMQDVISYMDPSDTRLSAQTKALVAQAYFATEQATSALMNELCKNGLVTAWEAPQA